MLFFFSSCFVPRYKLNKQEADFIANQEKFVTISIKYDSKAVRSLDSNGIYKVEYNERKLSSFPGQDEAIAKAVRIANKLIPIMKFKDHHQYIYVVLTGTDNYGNLYDSPREYSCTVGVPIANTEDAFIVERMRWNMQPVPRMKRAG